MQFKVVILYVLAGKLIVHAVTQSIRVVIRCDYEQGVVEFSCLLKLVHEVFQCLVKLHLGCDIGDRLIRVAFAGEK